MNRKDMPRFVAERNAALYSLDEGKIKKYCHKYGVPIPEDPTVFWGGIYKAILATANPPQKAADKARSWLDEHGFKHYIS